jgi:hypothetical protein
MTDWSENKSISMLKKAKEGGYAVLAQVWYVPSRFRYSSPFDRRSVYGIGGSLHAELTTNNLTFDLDLDLRP